MTLRPNNPLRIFSTFQKGDFRRAIQIKESGETPKVAISTFKAWMPPNYDESLLLSGSVQLRHSRLIVSGRRGRDWALESWTNCSDFHRADDKYLHRSMPVQCYSNGRGDNSSFCQVLQTVGRSQVLTVTVFLQLLENVKKKNKKQIFANTSCVQTWNETRK